ncbi:MAG TPA: glycosyltransferase family 4 protein [Thermoanaerobaculia bacterium]|nr:glycosyltransferase family 4 protein [Thermoanaerobaculia bacterium]
MDEPLRIAYLMEDTDLSGGVRVQLAQADALIGRGHRVTIFTKGMPLTWRTSEAEWEYVDTFRGESWEGFDFVIGTFWTTVGPAWEGAGERALHLCQGLEFTFTAYQEIRPRIEQTYRLPIPKLVVGPHLEAPLARFGQETVVIGQVVDEPFFRPSAGTTEGAVRVLLPGPAQIDVKGIDVGYGAALHARAQGADFDLVRVSPWAPSREEPRETAAEFHVALDSRGMVELVGSCEVLLAPSRKEEGFGLPAAEGMAAGLACVLTRIPSFLAFDRGRTDYALWAEEDDAVGLGEQIMRLLGEPELRRAVASRGREVAAQFRAELVADRMERWLLERRKALRSR